MSIRLSKQLSSVMRLCSRREAEEWITMGNLFVNEQPVFEVGFKVNPGDHLRIRNDPTNRTYTVKPIPSESESIKETDSPASSTAQQAPVPRLFLAHKLKGEILDRTKPMNFFSRIFDLGAPKGLMIASAGLDVMCSGVVLLTDSSKLCQVLEHAPPMNQIYHVTCVGKSPPDQVALRWLGSGRAKFGNQYLAPMSSTILQSRFSKKDSNYRTTLSIAYRGGKFKHYRNVFSSIGLICVEAERRRIGPSLFSTHELQPGEICELQPKVIKTALDKILPTWQADMRKELSVLKAEHKQSRQQPDSSQQQQQQQQQHQEGS